MFFSAAKLGGSVSLPIRLSESAELPRWDSPGSSRGSARGLRERSRVGRAASADSSNASRGGSLAGANGGRSPAGRGRGFDAIRARPGTARPTGADRSSEAEPASRRAGARGREADGAGRTPRPGARPDCGTEIGATRERPDGQGPSPKQLRPGPGNLQQRRAGPVSRKAQRRRIVHFKATTNPTAQWVIQQVREAFPYDSAPGYLIFDNDSIFSDEVTEAIEYLDIEPKRTAFQSPWQNGTAERWVGSARRELLNHVIVFNEQHLHCLLHDYVAYYNAERVHTQLRDSPAGRAMETRPSPKARVVGLPRGGGLHHRYVWREAA